MLSRAAAYPDRYSYTCAGCPAVLWSRGNGSGMQRKYCDACRRTSADYSEATRARWVAEGRCQHCGKPNPDAGRRKNCGACRARLNARARARAALRSQ